EVQAMWKRGLPESAWREAHAVFQPTSEESGGHWDLKKKVAEKWMMNYTPLTSPHFPRSSVENGGNEGGIKFWTMTTPGRHLGVFPEVAAHWDWLSGLIAQSKQGVNVLNLFGYTGLASLA